MAEAGTTDGRLHKMEVDCSAEVDVKLPECERLMKEYKIDETLRILSELEKKARLGSDTHSLSRVLVAIVVHCFEAYLAAVRDPRSPASSTERLDLLCETIVGLSKKRSQIRQSTTRMIQECCTFVERTEQKDHKLKLIETLRSVTAGKIYVEVERARLTRTLATIKEGDGAIEEAATVLQELQVETFGSMERREKLAFILEQMRLAHLRHDWIRLQIISRKINVKFLAEPSLETEKIRFHELMIALSLSDQQLELSLAASPLRCPRYLDAARHYRALYDTPSIHDDPVRSKHMLKCIVLYVLLAPYDNEQHDFMHRVMEEKALDNIPIFKELLKVFSEDIVYKWTELCARFEGELLSGGTDGPATGVFPPPLVPNSALNEESETALTRWRHLKARLVEHNVRVMATAYTRIRLARLGQLLELTVEEAEETLSNLVVTRTVRAKIDRPQGIVSFAGLGPGLSQHPPQAAPVPPPAPVAQSQQGQGGQDQGEDSTVLGGADSKKDEEEKGAEETLKQIQRANSSLLNDWARSVLAVMQLIGKATHLINKEEVVHGAFSQSRGNAPHPPTEN